MLRVFRACRSGTSAIEFAILAPLMILVLLTFIGFGVYLSAAHAIQQVAADAARTAIAGLDSIERNRLALDFIKTSTRDYPLIDSAKLTVVVADDPGNEHQFTVSLIYDAEDLPIWNLFCLVLPPHRIERFSTIRIGGM